MYVPSLYKQENRDEILRLIRDFPFATVITWDESGPYANHLPVILDADGTKLLSHLSRSNPQLKHLEEGRDAMIVFNGPHSYISPSWYRGKEHVPTWNYAVVHVRGKARVSSAGRLREILDASVEVFEKTPGAYRFSSSPDLPVDFQEKLMRAIAGFEIDLNDPATTIDAKFKLGQNRNPDDYAGAIEGLARENSDMARGVREMMKRLERK